MPTRLSRGLLPSSRPFRPEAKNAALAIAPLAPAFEALSHCGTDQLRGNPVMRRFVLATALAIVVGLAGLVLSRGAARAETEVDLALVIAVDISYSMDPDEQKLQREGFIGAFRSAEVQDAIAHGLTGRIAVTYMEWAGASDQRVVVPWTLIEDRDSALAFAGQLEKEPTRRAARTSISGALDQGVRLLGASSVLASRRVIDVSGDGPNNQGRPVQAARADALAAGIIINGLPIMLKSAGYFDIPDLDLYYRDCVIGGPGAFMVPARDREQFREAIRHKILMEVAGDPEAARRFGRIPLPSLVRPAQSEAARANCLAGEIQWRDRMGN
jgi:hypothetical protein